MPRKSTRKGGFERWFCLACFLLGPAGTVHAGRTDEVASLSADKLWRRTVEQVTDGDFIGATESINKIQSGGKLADEVRVWLEEYDRQQEERRKLDLADFEKYVGYAKARIERKEYILALNWALAALDCAADRDAFFQSGWVIQLTRDALDAAEEHRKEAFHVELVTIDNKPVDDEEKNDKESYPADASPDDPDDPEGSSLESEKDEEEEDEHVKSWRKAWRIYSRLSSLYEREPRYEKLAREAATHIRLDAMFRKGSHWEENIEKVRWRDAQRALEYIEDYYVEKVDFKGIAEQGIEQILLLTESRTAQAVVNGLANENDRNDFVLRVRERLSQVQAVPTLSRDACVEHFRRIVRQINEQTVRIPTELLVVELMRGALDPLDDFTVIIWPQAIDEFDKRTRGNFVGVGISIVKNSQDEIEVVTPLDGTPAYRAGIQAGDVITRVDGQRIKGFSINKVVDIITGVEGTLVTLTIRRDEKDIEFPLERARVKIQSVKGIRRDPDNEERWEHWLDRDRGIAYIRITSFQGNTVGDVESVLSELNAQNLKGLVLDLRGNPGGLLDSAWRMSSLFLNKDDPVVSTKGRIKRENQSFEAPSDGPYADLPLVILVNESSASASEIVSGSIRDNGRAIVVGERTYGKFSVQNLVPLSRSGAKLKMTTSRYYLPNGVSLHREPGSETWGVTPDVTVRLVQKELVNLYRMNREADLLGPPKAVAEAESDADRQEDDKKTDDPAQPDKAGPKAGDTDKGDHQPPHVETGNVDKEKPQIAEGATGRAGEDKLPPLEQPDENDRPRTDPQRDTALLLMRVILADQSMPALAKAETPTGKETAQP